MRYIIGRNTRKFGGKTFTLEAIAYFSRQDAYECADEVRGKGALARVTEGRCDDGDNEWGSSTGYIWLVWANWGGRTVLSYSGFFDRLEREDS